MRIQLYFILFFVYLFLSIKPLWACESCTIPNLGRNQGMTLSQSKDERWQVGYLYEQQVWIDRPAREAHNLHHQGHHVHDKTREDFYHFTLAGQLTDQFTLHSDVPYVVRRSLEIDDHARLGAKEESRGLGDVILVGDYRFFKKGTQSLGLIGGFKLPTGLTHVKNSVGQKFEAELQPGTGSLDYILGGIYESQIEQFKILSNVAYVFKTEGKQNIQSGNLFSTSLFLDYTLNPKSTNFKSDVGIHANYQFEKKQRDDGITVKDSGGQTLYLGPVVTIAANSHVSLYSTMLFPVYQDLGGVHQEVDYTWTLGAKFNF